MINIFGVLVATCYTKLWVCPFQLPPCIVKAQFIAIRLTQIEGRYTVSEHPLTVVYFWAELNSHPLSSLLH